MKRFCRAVNRRGSLGNAAARLPRRRACGAGGTLPNARRACLKLGSLANPFAPVPANVGCSQIFSGPQVALATGSFRGHLVSTLFKRSDSCQTERWNRVAFLFPTTR